MTEKPKPRIEQGAKPDFSDERERELENEFFGTYLEARKAFASLKNEYHGNCWKYDGDNEDLNKDFKQTCSLAEVKLKELGGLIDKIDEPAKMKAKRLLEKHTKELEGGEADYVQLADEVLRKNEKLIRELVALPGPHDLGAGGGSAKLLHIALEEALREEKQVEPMSDIAFQKLQQVDFDSTLGNVEKPQNPNNKYLLEVDEGPEQIIQPADWQRIQTELKKAVELNARLTEQNAAFTKFLKDKKKYLREQKRKDVSIETATDFDFDEEAAKELGLKKVELEAYPETDELIARLFVFTEENPEKPNGDSIDISTSEGQEQFCREWVEGNPDLPMPSTPPRALFAELYPDREFPTNIDVNEGDFWYLKQLAQKRIVSNLEGEKKSLIPVFGSSEVILADSWVEQNWDAKDSGQETTNLKRIDSPLLEALLGEDAEGVVKISRETIDGALWEGDPSLRVLTERHKEILAKLGVDSENIEIHAIYQDQYARGAKDNSWGNSNLWTHQDGYFLYQDGNRYGLNGGRRDNGGASNVNYNWRDYADDDLAIRLVLSRKRGLDSDLD